MKKLIEYGCDINEKRVGCTALHYAAFYNFYSIVEYLVESGAEVNTENFSKVTPLSWYFLITLFLSIYSHYYLNFFYFVKKILIRNFYFCWLFHFEEKDKNSTLINTLIQNFKRAVDRGNLEIVKYLIDWDADVNMVDDKGFSPLHKAVLNGNSEACKILVEYGECDINIQTKDEEISPLHQAIIHARDDLAVFLILKGANLNIQTSTYSTPLHRFIFFLILFIYFVYILSLHFFYIVLF